MLQLQRSHRQRLFKSSWQQALLQQVLGRTVLYQMHQVLRCQSEKWTILAERELISTSELCGKLISEFGITRFRMIPNPSEQFWSRNPFSLGRGNFQKFWKSFLLQPIKGSGVTYRSEPYHRECFVCSDCDVMLAGQRFTLYHDNPICSECFGRKYAHKCYECFLPIKGMLLSDLLTLSLWWLGQPENWPKKSVYNAMKLT